MARALYSLAVWLALPLVLARLLWRARAQPDYLRHWGERFGIYAGRASRPLIWLHAVSVGEARAAQPLVAALASRHGDHDLLVTCMTPTGRATALALFGDRARVAYLPYDYRFAVRRFMRHWRPRLGIVMETEVWPNLVASARQAGTPMALVNARLSAHSAARYARFAALSRPAFAAFARVVAQTAGDAQRLAALGADVAGIAGNLKFDVDPPEPLLALGRSWRAAQSGRRVVLAASTREGEEALLLPVLRAIVAAGHLAVVVPRHPQRFEEVAALLGAAGALARRSALAPPPADCAFWLGDSLGEMPAYFAMADCAYVGGSLLPFGGQNMIEAAACGCPALFGPHTWNFAEAAEAAVAAGAAQRVGDPGDLAAIIETLLGDEAMRARMAQAGREFARSHRGATARTMELVAPLLPDASGRTGC